MTQPRFSLYVCWRRVYEAVEARKRAAAGRPAFNGHCALDLACACGQSIALGLAVAYSRRGYVVSHELLPAQTACPGCGERLSERTLLYRGVGSAPVDKPALHACENEGGAIPPDGD